MSGAARPSPAGWEKPAAYWDAAARRAHFRHGPIELHIQADGPEAAVKAALGRAWARFQTVLPELAAELPLLRAPVGSGAALDGAQATGSVARRMAAAVAPLGESAFVTPMAAVAGAVADEVLSECLAGAQAASEGLARVAVNNGGDIALWLSPGASFSAALAGADGRGLGRLELDGAALSATDGRAGIATSGWRGRSFSLGIADSVTTLASSAAAADAAATLIANAVDAPGHPGVRRAPARTLDPDSDLGDRLVTVATPTLTPAERADALDAGAAAAERFLTLGAIRSALLFLSGDVRGVGADLFRGERRRPTGKAA